MAPPHWDKVAEQLYQYTVATIRRLEAEHADDVFCCFAYAVDTMVGKFQLCFDTLHNSVYLAKEQEKEEAERRQRNLAHHLAWRSAATICGVPVTPYTQSTQAFAYTQYSELVFSDWEEFTWSEDYPKFSERDDDYLEGNANIVISRVIERLVEGNEFSRLRLAQPFYIGHEFHERGLTVMRILNWPEV
jgi:hypothetical protein